jgi:hypothetical protein
LSVKSNIENLKGYRWNNLHTEVYENRPILSRLTDAI